MYYFFFYLYIKIAAGIHPLDLSPHGSEIESIVSDKNDLRLIKKKLEEWWDKLSDTLSGDQVYFRLRTLYYFFFVSA